MIRPRNPALVVAACSALTVGLLAGFRPGSLRWEGPPSEEDSSRLAEIRQHRDRLEEQLEVARQQVAIYQEVLRGVIAGKVTLDEAAVALRNRVEAQGIAAF